MPSASQPDGGSPARDFPETRWRDRESDGPDRVQPIHESETIIGEPDAHPATPPPTAIGSLRVADREEFLQSLVANGLIGAQELVALATEVSPAEGVLGLARVLQGAGKLTAYQA